MSKPFTLTFALSLGCLTAYYQAVTPFGHPSYSKLAILGALLYILFRFLWRCVLYPLYFSPLLALPQAPQKPALRRFLVPTTTADILEWVDNIPNDGFIRYLDLFNSEVVLLTDPKLAQEVLQLKHENYSKPPKVKQIMEVLLGNGLVVAEGADHKYQRKHLLPAFHVKVVKNLYPLFWTKASELVSLLERDLKSGLKTVDVDQWASRVSLDIIGKAGFASDFNSLSEPNSSLNNSYRVAFMPDANSRFYLALSLLTHPKLVNLLPVKRSLDMNKGVNAIKKFVKDFIYQRQLIMKTNKALPDSPGEDGWKDIIAAAMKTGAFNTQDLVNQSMTLLGAGHETSATAVTWGLYLLSQPRYAHVQRHLRKEVRENLPSPSSGMKVDAEMLDKLPYLDAVNKEILRVYPPVPQTRRIALHDTDIGGLRITEGTTVMMNIWSFNKAKHLWGDDAREFNPERWLVGENAVHGGASGGLAYQTFSHGARSCIGRGFAIGENKALLAALIGSFEFKPLGGRVADPNILWNITAKLIDGLTLEADFIEGW